MTNITQDGEASHQPEKRGRKKAKDPLREIRLYINQSIICEGKEIDFDSQEYKNYLEKHKRKLTEYIYQNLPEGNPLKMGRI